MRMLDGWLSLVKDRWLGKNIIKDGSHAIVPHEKPLAKDFISSGGKLPQDVKLPWVGTTRPSWDAVWMSMAHLLAKRSIDPRTKVGALIVSDDNTRVLAVGYNGSYRGGPNEVESLEPGKSGLIHAETNALIKCDYHSLARKVMYATVSPCLDCAKLCINGHISEVVYDVRYRNDAGIKLLISAGVVVRQFSLT